MKSILLILTALCMAAGWAGTAVAAPLREALVVMVDARHGKDSPVSFGAGIILSQTKVRTVIATALHVVADNDGNLAPTIEIEFHGRRGKIYRATVSNAYVDVEMDLAVLLVDHASGGEPPLLVVGDAARRVSPTSPEELTGGAVQIIGAMDSERWAIGTMGDRVTSGSRWQLRVRSASARAGASGGGVFDTDGRIVGLCSRIDSATGELQAIPISAVTKRVRRWGIEVGLSEADAASTEPGIQAQVRAGLRIVVTPVEPLLNSNGDVITIGGGYPHRVRAELSPAVKELQPRVEIKGTNASFDPIVLRQPDYLLERGMAPVVLTAEAWAILPDGRRFGPVPLTLDFEKGPKAAAARGNALSREHLEASSRQFWWSEAQLRDARAHSDKAVEEARSESIRNSEQAIRTQLPLVFSSWKIRCKKEEAWVCGHNGYLPTTPFGGQLGNAIHSIKIGRSEQDLYIDLPLDSSSDLRAELPRRVVSLLEDGAMHIFIRVQLTTGEVLGPKQLCGVRQKSSRRPPQCD